MANRLTALARELHGSVVDPADPRYAMLAQPWNAHFASVQPLAVVVVADESDVARTGRALPATRASTSSSGTVATASPAIPPATASSSTSRSPTAVRPDPRAATAVVGAGWTNLPLYEALCAPHGGPGRDLPHGRRDRTCTWRRLWPPLAALWADQRQPPRRAHGERQRRYPHHRRSGEQRPLVGVPRGVAATSASSRNSRSGSVRSTCPSPISTTCSAGNRR